MKILQAFAGYLIAAEFKVQLHVFLLQKDKCSENLLIFSVMTSVCQ